MLNLRCDYVHINDTLESKLLDENISKLDKQMKLYLESIVPLTLGLIFDERRYDGINTRIKLLNLVQDKKLSLKVIQLEIKRRKRMKVARQST
ncbi:MAG: hypothetical protein M0R17_02765 [Candidatus Omnitrophica bacterium]|jgi:hypothetical protein|nr:hypothetical protein [Candidatus Omnitrophota bacterium]